LWCSDTWFKQLEIGSLQKKYTTGADQATKYRMSRVSSEQLKVAIEKARNRQMTPDERQAQMISFVWGNAPEGDQGTFETVRQHLHLS